MTVQRSLRIASERSLGGVGGVSFLLKENENKERSLNRENCSYGVV
jgi:hypothetical protein